MREVWSFEQRPSFLTSVLSTGGDVAFVGDLDRNFRALDVRTGKILWQTRLGNSVQGYPISSAPAESSMSPSPPASVAAVHAMSRASSRRMSGTRQAGNAIYVFELPE